MKLKCKHCGTGFAPEQGAGEFCCAGCEQVYQLIRSEGLDTYYTLQDRVGQPVGDVNQPQLQGLRALQLKVEGDSGQAHLTLKVAGMSCLGCIWLVERLARAQEGCIAAQTSLQSNTLTLSWKKGVFDLAKLARLLAGFGYQLAEQTSDFRGWSPLAWRAAICSVLALNSILLFVVRSVLGEGAPVLGLVQMLLLGVTAISLLVGVPQFVSPVVRSFRMRIWHYDGFTCASLVLLLPTQLWSELAWLLPVVLALVLLGRLVQVHVWQALLARFEIVLQMRESGFHSLNHLMGLNTLACLPVVGVALFGYGDPWTGQVWELAAGLCLVFGFYPIAIAMRYEVPHGWLAAGFALCWGGALLLFGAALGVVAASLWMVFSGLGWMIAFVVWQRRQFGTN